MAFLIEFMILLCEIAPFFVIYVVFAVVIKKNASLAIT